MAPGDDVEAFQVFEIAAEACGWPPAQWALRLLTLLTGDRLTAAQGLPTAAHLS